MPNTVSDYFTDELLEWNESISFYSGEIKSFTLKFSEVLRRNSILGIAEKVESHQLRLNQVLDKFTRLKKQIREQEKSLEPSSVDLLDDDKISREIEKKQVDIRISMQSVEKEYIAIKYECYHFLAGVIKK